MEARYPSTSLLLEHGIIWVNPTRPWPSGKHVRNENSGGPATFIVVFLEGRLFPIDGSIGETFMHPDDKDRNTKEGARDEQAAYE